MVTLRMTPIQPMRALLAALFVVFAILNAETSAIKTRKILVTNFGISGSQNLLMARLADKLGSRGNDVTFLQYEVMKQAKTVKLTHAKRLVYRVIEDEETMRQLDTLISSSTWEKESMGFSDVKHLFGTVTNILSQVTGGCDRLLEQNRTMVNEMKAAKYDAIVIHALDMCTLALTRHLNIKAYALFSSAFLIDPMAHFSGVSSPASYVPSMAMVATDQMSFPERLQNLFMGTFVTKMFEAAILRPFNTITRKHFGTDYPTMQELMTETQLFFINTDAFFEYPRPSQANIIEVGGFTMTHPEPLKEEWLKVLDQAKDGVVVFSMGTVANTSHMPEETKMALVNAFKRFPTYTFITRIEADMTAAKKVPNIHLTSWLPQKDLLAHSKVKAFITHGGYNSLTEATYLGVPLVMLPLLGDQLKNAKRVERLGLGVSLDKNTLTETGVHDALDTVLNNPEYARKAAHVSQMMRGKPFSSEETAMRWIEFLADYKDLDVLKPESRHMSFVTYYNLDVLAFLHVIAAVSLYCMYAVMRCCYRRCCAKKAVTTSKKKRQ